MGNPLPPWHWSDTQYLSLYLEIFTPCISSRLHMNTLRSSVCDNLCVITKAASKRTSLLYLMQVKRRQACRGKSHVCCSRQVGGVLEFLLVNKHIMCWTMVFDLSESVLRLDIQDVTKNHPVVAWNWENGQFPLYVNTVHCCIHKCDLGFK